MKQVHEKKIMEIVDIRIRHYYTNYKGTSAASHVVSRIKSNIKELHKTYLLVPADKEFNHIVLVYKGLQQ